MFRKLMSSMALLGIPALLMAAAALPPASAEIATACTTSLVGSIAPCLKYLTGGRGGSGGGPTADCCDALGGLLSSSAECGCLILTGNVPFGLPFNPMLAITLPSACNSEPIPLQCKGTAMPLPPPGPIPFEPGLPPFPTWPTLPPPAKALLSLPSPPAPEATTPLPVLQAAAPSVPTQLAKEGLRPLALATSAAQRSSFFSVSQFVPVAVGAMVLSGFLVERKQLPSA